MDHLTIGLVGGSGLGRVLAEVEGTRHDISTPFGKPSGPVIEADWEGVRVLLLSRHGPGHLLNPSEVPYRANIFALKQLGATHVLASGAVGSLREEYRPRDLVVIDQAIDKTFRRAGTFFDRAAVHVELAEPFCPVMRRIIVEAAGSPGDHTVHTKGTYVCMEGPAFSTRAESTMHRLWGGDVIGMTAMPEAKLAKEAELAYALVALVTDYDCWRTPPTPKEGGAAPSSEELLKEIIGNLNAATENATALLRRAVRRMGEHREALAASPARRALELAIWSDKAKIAAEEVQRLAPLWMRYFEKDAGAGVLMACAGFAWAGLELAGLIVAQSHAARVEAGIGK